MLNRSLKLSWVQSEGLRLEMEIMATKEWLHIPQTSRTGTSPPHAVQEITFWGVLYLSKDNVRWTPSHGHAKVGLPAQTYIQQFCEDTGCRPGDLPEAMNVREGWWENARDIHTNGATRWWWWWWWWKG